MTDGATRLGPAAAVRPTAPPADARHGRVAALWPGWASAALVLPALAASALVYLPITRSYFFSDDFLNLYNINNYSLTRYLLTPNGGHLLVVRNAIFYLTFLLAGTHPEPYYWSVLVAHLLNVWLLFRVIRGFTGSALLGSFGAALWGTSPLSEGSLGWYSVFGHVLVATALLIILDRTAVLAERGEVPSRAMRALWFALALAAVTSFGVGISLALALPFALALLLPQWRGHLPMPPLASLLVVVPVLYVLLTWAYLKISHDTLVAGTPWGELVRDWRGIGLIYARLLGFGLSRLVLGFYQPAWLDSGAWYAALAVLALCIGGAALRAPAAVRRQLAAVVLLLLACYGMIAIGRAALLLKSPRDMISGLFRYHYVGQLLYALLLCLLLARLAAVPGRLKHAALAAWYAATLALWALLAPTLDTHDDARTATQRALAEIDAAIHAQPEGADVYLPNLMFKPLPWYPAVFPGRAAAFIIFHPSNVVDGRRVHFAEANHRVVELTRDGRRTGGLLVPAGPATQPLLAPPASSEPPLASAPPPVQ